MTVIPVKKLILTNEYKNHGIFKCPYCGALASEIDYKCNEPWCNTGYKCGTCCKDVLPHRTMKKKTVKIDLTERQKEVLLDLRKGRKMTYHGYHSVPPSVTWDDVTWSPYQKNYIVVVRSLLKKKLVWLESTSTFHVHCVRLTEEGKNGEID
jgi:DNA-directed RNA polymerase subunit RPC12/RpoP